MPEDADILAGLHGLREVAPVWSDLAVALAAGLLVAVLLWLIVRLFQARPTRPDVAGRVGAARALPPSERAAALTGLLRDLTDRAAPGRAPWAGRAAIAFGLESDRLERLRTALYLPGTPVDLEELEALVRRAARTAGR